MNLEDETLTDLLFLLKTEKVKNDPDLLKKIQDRIDEIKRESEINKNIDIEKAKSRSKYKWILLSIIAIFLSYCSYEVFTSKNYVKRIVYHYQTPVPPISLVDSKRLIDIMADPSFHEDAIMEFPDVGKSMESRIRINTRTETTLVTNEKQGRIKIEFVVNENEAGKYDQNAILAFYLVKVIKLLNLKPESYLEDYWKQVRANS